MSLDCRKPSSVIGHMAARAVPPVAVKPLLFWADGW
jgi:hypothetical protein